MRLLFSLAVVAITLAACAPPPSVKTDDDRARAACIDTGGVPISSKFNGVLAECRYPQGVPE